MSTMIRKSNISNTTSVGWVRPSDWLPMPVVLASEQKFVGLHAIHPDSNFLSLTASGAYTVNWGDGTIENFTSGTQANHIYDYTNQILNDTYSSRGYKQVIVTVTPQSGAQLTAIDINKKHPSAGSVMYNSGWLDIVLGSPYFSSQGLVISTNNGSVVVNKHSIEHVKITNFGNITFFQYGFYAMSGLASVELANTGLITNMSNLFNACYSLSSVPIFDTSKVTNTSQMFSYCPLITVPLYDFGLVVTASSMFTGCQKLTSIPAFNLIKCTTAYGLFYSCVSLTTVSLITFGVLTDASYMFYGCINLVTTPLFNFGTVTNMNSMFSSCYSLRTVPLFDTIKVISAQTMFYNCYSLSAVPTFDLRALNDMGTMFYGCQSLSALPAFNLSAVTSAVNAFSGNNSFIKISFTGLGVNFSLYGLKLSSTALNEIYTNLPVVTGKTLTVTANWGAASSNTSIATAKGWTIVT